jgi:hypothetical protein
LRSFKFVLRVSIYSFSLKCFLIRHERYLPNGFPPSDWRLASKKACSDAEATQAPTLSPTKASTSSPPQAPTFASTLNPTSSPTNGPTYAPTSQAPSLMSSNSESGNSDMSVIIYSASGAAAFVFATGTLFFIYRIRRRRVKKHTETFLPTSDIRL